MIIRLLLLILAFAVAYYPHYSINTSKSPYKLSAHEIISNTDSLPISSSQLKIATREMPAANFILSDPLLTETTGPASTKQDFLKGSVQGTKLLSPQCLGQISGIAEGLKRSCLMVMAELTRTQAIYSNGPNVLSNGSVIPATPTPSGVIYSGDLDVRPSVLNHSINMVIAYSQQLEAAIGAIIIPDNASKEIKEHWDKIRELSEEIHTSLFYLTSLARSPSTLNSKSPIYSKLHLARAALDIYDKSEAINKSRHQLLQDLKHSSEKL